MAPNLLLPAFTPALTGPAAETAAKSSRLHRLYDFIVETQSRRAEQEVARYRRRSGQDPVPRNEHSHG
jgi:hypothetical protein